MFELKILKVTELELCERPMPFRCCLFFQQPNCEAIQTNHKNEGKKAPVKLRKISQLEAHF
jgi:hypothetical protein